MQEEDGTKKLLEFQTFFGVQDQTWLAKHGNIDQTQINVTECGWSVFSDTISG